MAYTYKSIVLAGLSTIFSCGFSCLAPVQAQSQFPNGAINQNSQLNNGGTMSTQQYYCQSLGRYCTYQEWISENNQNNQQYYCYSIGQNCNYQQWLWEQQSRQNVKPQEVIIRPIH